MQRQPESTGGIQHIEWREFKLESVIGNSIILEFSQLVGAYESLFFNWISLYFITITQN